MADRLFIDLEKGAGHKYIRRIPTGKPRPRYRYIYDARKAVDTKAKPQVGEKIKVTHNGQAGHYEVKKVLSGGRVHVEHDETGHRMVIHATKLHDLTTAAHAPDKAKAQDKNDALAEKHKKMDRLPRRREDVLNAIKQASGIDDHDLAQADAAYSAWKGRGRKGPKPARPPGMGGELDAFSGDLKRGQKFSSLLEAFEHATKGAQTWRDIAPVMAQLREVPGFEGAHLPEDALLRHTMQDEERRQQDEVNPETYGASVPTTVDEGGFDWKTGEIHPDLATPAQKRALTKRAADEKRAKRASARKDAAARAAEARPQPAVADDEPAGPAPSGPADDDGFAAFDAATRMEPEEPEQPGQPVEDDDDPWGATDMWRSMNLVIDLRKADGGAPTAAHKYVSRKPKAGGGWEYEYAAPAGQRPAAPAQEATAVGRKPAASAAPAPGNPQAEFQRLQQAHAAAMEQMQQAHAAMMAHAQKHGIQMPPAAGGPAPSPSANTVVSKVSRGASASADDKTGVVAPQKPVENTAAGRQKTGGAGAPKGGGEEFQHLSGPASGETPEESVPKADGIIAHGIVGHTRSGKQIKLGMDHEKLTPQEANEASMLHREAQEHLLNAARHSGDPKYKKAAREHLEEEFALASKGVTGQTEAASWKDPDEEQIDSVFSSAKKSLAGLEALAGWRPSRMWAGEDDLGYFGHMLAKSAGAVVAGHKYIRRTPKVGGGYDYEYAHEPHSKEALKGAPLGSQLDIEHNGQRAVYTKVGRDDWKGTAGGTIASGWFVGKPGTFTHGVPHAEPALAPPAPVTVMAETKAPAAAPPPKAKGKPVQQGLFDFTPPAPPVPTPEPAPATTPEPTPTPTPMQEAVKEAEKQPAAEPPTEAKWKKHPDQNAFGGEFIVTVDGHAFRAWRATGSDGGVAHGTYGFVPAHDTTTSIPDGISVSSHARKGNPAVFAGFSREEAVEAMRKFAKQHPEKLTAPAPAVEIPRTPKGKLDLDHFEKLGAAFGRTAAPEGTMEIPDAHPEMKRLLDAMTDADERIGAMKAWYRGHAKTAGARIARETVAEIEADKAVPPAAATPMQEAVAEAVKQPANEERPDNFGTMPDDDVAGAWKVSYSDEEEDAADARAAQVQQRILDDAQKAVDKAKKDLEAAKRSHDYNVAHKYATKMSAAAIPKKEAALAEAQEDLENAKRRQEASVERRKAARAARKAAAERHATEAPLRVKLAREARQRIAAAEAAERAEKKVVMTKEDATKRNRQRERELGEHIADSAKDRSDERMLLTKGDLDKLSFSEAHRLVNKRNAMPVYSSDQFKARGASPGAAHLGLAMANLVGTSPPEDSDESRRAYLDGIRLVRGVMDRAVTVADYDAAIRELKEISGLNSYGYGRPIDVIHQGRALTAEEKADLKRKGQVWNDYAGIDRPVGNYAREVLLPKLRAQNPDPDLRIGLRFVDGDNGDRDVQFFTYSEKERTSLATSINALGKRFSDHVLHGGKLWVDANASAQKAESMGLAGWDHLEKTGEAKAKAKEETRKQEAADEAAGEGREVKFRWRQRIEEAPAVVRPKKAIAEADPVRLQKTFNFRNAGQPGASIPDKELNHHRRYAEMAFHDLADIVGVEPAMISMNGRLAVAFAARGKGKAAAHYEPAPDKRVINITRFAGAGTLAHEWGHFFDNILAEQHRGSNTASSVFGSAHWRNMPAGELRDAFKAFEDALNTPNPASIERMKTKAQDLVDDINKLRARRREIGNQARGRPDMRLTEEERLEVKDIDAGIKAYSDSWGHVQKFLRNPVSDLKWTSLAFDGMKEGKYWSQPEEMWARSFEHFVQHKLESQGRRNSYLVDGTKDDYGPYPQPEEHDKIHGAIARVIAAATKGGHFEKAMRAMGPISVRRGPKLVIAA